ncbi:conserved hypothetical protein [Candida dubliniensis CD36]|uniref:Uncharacterized protein n=1 Tax=Candida dubliniensis (strain CD36 / ATCC MYA-646 / CBS 7987 / NCPF 3949 / NRRL Y-17841) TaxID=573826 RepID=B9WEK6_CANDC|nr:conserved hypothetical protein [Candida dubliniensis CD36]CAX43118.1 conserved hypothetical protein [Candida dubliniensis CD36]
MPPKRNQKSQLSLSKTFEQVDDEIEDEIFETYSELLGDDVDHQDVILSQLPQILSNLRIPKCFTKDIEQCVDYYYDFIKDKDVHLDSLNTRQQNTLAMINSYTVTSGIKQLDEIIDIIDVEKLLYNLNRLVKFRNNYSHISKSWQLFVNSATGSSASEIFKLTLPDLKKIKTNLNLDSDPSTKAPLSDTFLIDMLGCCSHDSKGNLLNFDFEKKGACVTVKDFAEILGQIGELE